jgi:hypothetical protein
VYSSHPISPNRGRPQRPVHSGDGGRRSFPALPGLADVSRLFGGPVPDASAKQHEPDRGPLPTSNNGRPRRSSLTSPGRLDRPVGIRYQKARRFETRRPARISWPGWVFGCSWDSQNLSTRTRLTSAVAAWCPRRGAAPPHNGPCRGHRVRPAAVGSRAHGVGSEGTRVAVFQGWCH